MIAQRACNSCSKCGRIVRYVRWNFAIVEIMKESLDLDALDRRIVMELQRDGALSNTDLAQRVGSTAPSCWRRVKQLEDVGVLRKPVWLADPERLGQGVNVICNVRLKGHQTESVEAFETFVRDQPRMMECYSMSGEWDYMIRVVARDVRDYEAFLMRVLLKHPSVGAASSHFALRAVKYETALPLPTV